MGVPSFFRWLSAKFPDILDDVIECGQSAISKRKNACPNKLFLGRRPQNQRGASTDVREYEVDALYLDCNGIIHPCCHPDGLPQPTSEEEMLENISKFLDRLFNAIRPKKLLYLAIDGCAPRAKMNQQRARRFCSAREAEENAHATAAIRSSRRADGVPSSSQRWDHNVITPGTKFMDKVANHMRKWARKGFLT